MKVKSPNFLFIKSFFFKFLQKNTLFKRIFIHSFLLLFVGLFSGSLFGTFLDFPRSLGFWDGFIILFVICLSEIVNICVYVYEFSIFKSINYFKIGFLLALFIDAFKVGS